MSSRSARDQKPNSRITLCPSRNASCASFHNARSSFARNRTSNRSRPSPVIHSSGHNRRAGTSPSSRFASVVLPDPGSPHSNISLGGRSSAIVRVLCRRSILLAEQDDRDFAAGLLFVLLVQREDARHLGPEGPALVRGRDAGARGEPPGADLDPDARVRLVVLEPPRVVVVARLWS